MIQQNCRLMPSPAASVAEQELCPALAHRLTEMGHLPAAGLPIHPPVDPGDLAGIPQAGQSLFQILKGSDTP
jgi:hypothetical protein